MLSLEHAHRSRSGLNIPRDELMIKEESRKPPAAAFTASPSPFMAKHDNSSIQNSRGDEEAKHGDGDTKNLIRGSHSRVLVQYGSGISSKRSSKSL